MDTKSMGDLINSLNNALIMLGGEKALSKEKELSLQEKKELIFAKRGIYLNHSMLKNEIIKEKDLIALRPCVGIPAKYYNKIIGKKLKIDKKSFTALSFEEFTK